MTCRDIDELIASYASGVDSHPAVAAHISGCERCRRLAEALRHSAPSAPPSSEQLKRIKDAIKADLKPVRPLSSPGVLWSAFLLILVTVVTIGVIALGTAGWHALSELQKVAVFGALITAAGALSVSAERQMVPGSIFRLSPHALFVAVFCMIVATCAVSFRPQHETTFVATGLVCLRIGLECALPAALLLWLVLRRGAILYPMLAGMIAGALAGLSGLLVLEIFCPNLNRNHILVWHVGAFLATLLGGMIIGTLARQRTVPGRTPGQSSLRNRRNWR